MLFDTHAHLNDRAFDCDRTQLLETLPQQGVTFLMNAGCSLESSRECVAMAQQYPYVYAAVGSHPDVADEVEILKGKSGPLEREVRPVIDREQLLAIMEQVNKVQVSDAIYSYVAQLSKSTREHAYIDLGLSPRGSIAAVRMAKAWAYLEGRDYVLPEDVVSIFLDIAKHRIVLNTKARVARVTEAAVLEEVLAQTKQPASYMKRDEYRG